MTISVAEALDRGPLVLDGGLSTELERAGHDLSTSLWSARLLQDDPVAIRDVHRSFMDAGAQILTTASYQASMPGFVAAGLGAEAASALIARSVELARSVADEASHPVWVAGSAGPYGAYLADGSEYTGDYGSAGLAELRAFHRDQIARLFDAGADVIACETIPSLVEVQAVVDSLEELGVPGWVSLTTATGPDGDVVTRRGELAAEAFALAAGAGHVLAVGANCTAPQGISDAVAIAARASGKPAIAYPNSGEGWDAASHTWTGTSSPTFTAESVQNWLDAGAAVIGGCCRVSPAQIAALTELLGDRFRL